jgi:hypothetical protein
MHQSSVLSLRIDSKDLEKLQKEAHRSRLALNSFIRQVLLSYLEWERPALDGGMLPMRKKMLRALLECASEEQLARIAAEDAEAAVGEMYRRNDLDSFLSLTRLWMQKSGFALAEYFRRRGAAFQQVDDALNYHAGLAAAGTCHYQQWAGAVCHCALLVGV